MNILRIISLLLFVSLSGSCGKVRYVPGEDGATLSKTDDQTGITTGKNGDHDGVAAEAEGGADAGDDLGGATAGGATAGGATAGGLDGSDSDSKAPVSLLVRPSTASIPRGTTELLLVEATLADGSVIDVTAEATFAVLDESVLKLNTAAGPGIVEGLAIGTSDVIVSYKTKSTKSTITVTDAIIQSLAIDPATATVPTGLIQFVQANASFSDGSTRNVTTTATWEVDVAALGEFGQLRGDWLELVTKAAGNLTVTAKFQSKSASAVITIKDVNFVGFKVDPSAATLKIGETVAIKAIGVSDVDGDFDVTSNTQWSSSDTAIATVSNTAGSHGRVSAKERGNADVTAAFKSFTAKSAITVELPDDVMLQAIDIVDQQKNVVDMVELAVGESADWQVLGEYSDNKLRIVPDAEVVWSSSASGTASVDAVGKVEGKTPGNATVQAKVGALTASAGVTVKFYTNTETQAIVVNPTVLDMVWLVDNSPSMQQEIDQVRVNIKRFTDSIAATNDIHVHVISAKTATSSFVQTLDVPVQTNISQYDFLVDSLQPVIIAALATCPPTANFYDKNALSSSKVCDIAVSSFWGVEKYYPGLNGVLSGHLRPEARRVYVLVTDDDLVTSESLRKKIPGAVVVDHKNFRSAVEPYGSEPTVYAFAGLTANGCDVASEAVSIKNLANESGGDVYDICAADWSSNFDKLKADVQYVKFTLAKPNITAILSVKQGSRVIDPSKYKFANGVLSVHSSGIDTTSTDPLSIEYSYIP